MPLWTAVLIFILSVAGVITASICLRQKKAVWIILTVICVFIMILSVIYIGLTALFLDAARNKPPVEVLLLTDMGTPL